MIESIFRILHTLLTAVLSVVYMAVGLTALALLIFGILCWFWFVPWWMNVLLLFSAWWLAQEDVGL